MSGSQEARVALLSVQGEGTIIRILYTNLSKITEIESTELLMVTQQILSRVAQNLQPVREIQQLCNDPAEIADLRNQVTSLSAQTQPAPLECIHTNYERQLQTLRTELEEARRTPGTIRTDDDQRGDLGAMTRDVREATEKAQNLRTQLAHALSIAAPAAPAAPQQHEKKGQKFPDSPDFSGSNCTQSIDWIAQL
jgi:hypothetical protein